MAGLSGKTGWVGIARQTGKVSGPGGVTAPATPQFRNPFSGGNIQPTRETDRLNETDSSRDQGAAYITSAGVEGSPEMYVRDDSLGIYLAAALGNPGAPGGTTPNFVHTFKPQQSLDYYTFWRNVGGDTNGITEKFTDCYVSGLTITADAGAPLTCTANIMGLQATALAAPITTPTLNSGRVYSFNDAAVSLGGGVATPTTVRTISSFELTIENNVSMQQTDDVVAYDLSANQREISLGFDMIFENTTEYLKFHYGGALGQTQQASIFTTNAKFVFNYGGANNEISFELPSIAYEEFPVEPDPGGDPITVSCRAVAQKATGVTDLLTAIVKNQVTTYAT